MTYMQDNIKHVVHLMLENRSFDHLLGWLRWNGSAKPKNHVPPLRPNEKEFYGLNGTEWLPSNSSYFLPLGPFQYKREPITKITPGSSFDYCEMPSSDPGEEFEHVAVQLHSRDGVTPMGFYIDFLGVYIWPTSPRDILGVFTPDTLPCMNTLAENFAVSDMWFASVPTMTNPNRAFSICGTSMGRINNNEDLETYRFCGQPYPGINTIFSVFNAYNQNNQGKPPVTWKLYAKWDWHNVSPSPTHPLISGWKSWQKSKEAGKLCYGATTGKYYTDYMFPKGFENMRWGGKGTITDFLIDVSQDRLPSFSYIEPSFFPQTTVLSHLTDYHPPESVYRGEIFIAEIFNALVNNPAVWAKTLLIITFDEHGGTYDHIMPPSNAIAPDANKNPRFDFTRYGVRIPTLLISPWVTPGTIFRAGYYPEVKDKRMLPFDHTSVLATLCKWKGIPYQDQARYPDYYLGNRTASAPTFENVITNVKNNQVPSLKQHSCSVGATGVVKRPELIRAMTRSVAGMTGLSEAEVIQQRIVENIFNTCQTEDELKAYFDNLAKQHGKPEDDDESAGGGDS
jgi:phospholipase C